MSDAAVEWGSGKTTDVCHVKVLKLKSPFKTAADNRPGAVPELQTRKTRWLVPLLSPRQRVQQNLFLIIFYTRTKPQPSHFIT